MTRRDLILQMAAAIWRQVIDGVSRAPKAVVEAAGELASLYELANRQGVLDVAQRLGAAGAGVDVAECLVQLALGDAPDSYVDAAARAGISVPTFDIEVEHHGDDIDFGWDGVPEPRGGIHPHQNPHRNQAKRNGDGPLVLLLEDQVDLQKATTRMIKKVLPGANVVISDNVDGVIGNLRYLEPKLIVSDVDVLGNKSGIDLFRYIKDKYPQYVDRFVFFTGNLDAQDEHYRFVSKPATWKDLQEAILAPSPENSARATTPPPVAVAPGARGAGQQPPPSRHVPTTAEVAALVREVMPGIQSSTDSEGRWMGRAGDRKVFVAAIWRRLRDDPRLGGMSLGDFKRALVAANRSRELSLARADLVGAMNHNEVSESEIADSIATFHFVIDEPAASNAGLVAAVLSVLPRISEKAGPSGLPMGRYGSEEVFIAAVWRKLRMMPGYRSLDLGDFKQRLLVANRDQALSLARADLVDAMDPEEVELSKIDDGISTFHFIVDPAPNRREGVDRE